MLLLQQPILFFCKFLHFFYSLFLSPGASPFSMTLFGLVRFSFPCYTYPEGMPFYFVRNEVLLCSLSKRNSFLQHPSPC